MPPEVLYSLQLEESHRVVYFKGLNNLEEGILEFLEEV
jgi:hypothetical protein